MIITFDDASTVTVAEPLTYAQRYGSSRLTDATTGEPVVVAWERVTHIAPSA